MAEKKAYGTVLIKAKAILDYMMSQDTGLTLKEISEGIQAPKSTTLKILTTMGEQNIIWRNDDTKQYFFGTELIGYGQRALADFDISRIALPFLKKLRDKTEETVHLGIEQNNKVVYLQKLESPQSINLKSRIGGKLNLYSSAMGKAILASKTPEELDEYFSKETLKPVTDYTIISISELNKQIAAVKENGYSIDDKENQPEVVCVGAVLQKNGQVYGAFSVSTPDYRLGDHRRDQIIQYVLETKKEIEQAL
ncbi:IclR family transcriptional regulator [Companilactobacillus suantsaicola]|uniref:IclR family transcriptional regulator n=1 Tax=Companilactobacillus suantsaicola TaxID=2487723 RepID=A0A4Z0JG21_9LACO|nr:IclR family transcriptional regulator [Companilactobacillus suantsaicola]TGD21631.1 IclR family transcriptional regulator [Companilactobacillus suantsaicola]